MIEAQKDAAPVAQSYAVSHDANLKTMDLPVVSILDAGERSVVKIGVYPKWMHPILRLLPWNVKGMKAQYDFFGLVVAAVSARLKRGPREDDEEDEQYGTLSNKTSTDLIQKLLEVRDENGSSMPTKEIVAEAIILLGAGSDTTSK
jgi:cytochrome P450